MKPTSDLYQEYVSQMRRIADIRNANALLQWDQETLMPPKGAAIRGQQISTLSEVAHHYFSDEGLGGILKELSSRNDLDENQEKNVELTLEDYTKNKKYTAAFVRELSEQINRTFHSWIEARKQNSFAVYEKDLSALIELKKKESDVLGYTEHPYNAHLNEYEKGSTVAQLDTLFDDLLPKLKTLLDKIMSKGIVDDRFLHQQFPKQQQWDWGMQLIKQLNYDMEAGRQDISEHPFSTSFSPQDVRITTRIDENNFGNMTWSCIHEVGHALYEQGLLTEYYGLPMGEACSYSLHESQSRLWENNVGRSKGFWQHYLPQLTTCFPEQFKNVSLDQFYAAINKVQPSLIRTEADEVTYHFHVYIRYSLEKKLMDGSLAAKDISAYWNEQYQKWLGVKVTDDKHGALQDVHWSHGSFGYFPTYSVGSFYAAQFYAQAEKEIGGLQEQISKGETQQLLEWLRKNIHQYGKKYTGRELCERVTGQPLDVAYFLNYIEGKYDV